MKKKQNEKCYLCGKEATHYHHIIPRSLGGRTAEWNLVPLCDECEQKLHKLIDPLISLLRVKN